MRSPWILTGLCLAAALTAMVAFRAPAPATCPGTPCGTAIILARAEPGSLFPPAIEYSTDANVIDLMYLRLADLGPSINTIGDTGYAPRLAASWRRESPLTVTFQLDPRARWQDGVPVDARDVAFTFDVYRDTLVNASARPLLGVIASVTPVDPHTVTFRFQRAYPEQLYDATQHMRILPRHLMDTISRARLVTHPLASAPIGDGPYRFVSWRRGESFELAADSTFFLGGPGLAWLIWRRDMDYASTTAKLLAGEADFMEHLGTPENIDRVAAARDVRIVEYLSTNYMYLLFNFNDPGALAQPHPLFGSRDLRRALSQAVDRRTVVQVAYGRYAGIAVGPLSRLSALGRDTTMASIPYDPAAAAQALDRLGWKDTNGDGVRDQAGRKLSFELMYPTSSMPRTRAAEVIRDQLAKVGVEARLAPRDFNTMGNATQSRKFDAALMGWNDDPTPSGIRQNWSTAGIGGSNYGGYANPEFDRLVDLAIGEFDAARARQRWRAAYTTIIEDAPAIWLATPTQVAAVHRRLENVTLQPQEWTATLWTWRVTPGKTVPRDLVAAPSGPR